LNNNDYFFLKQLAENTGEALASLRSQMETLEANIESINERMATNYSKSFTDRVDTTTRLAKLERAVETDTNKKVSTKGVKLIKKPLPVVKTLNAPFIRKRVTND